MRNLRITGITLVLAFFFLVQLGFIAYAALGGIVGALLILGPIIGLQWLVFSWLRRRGFGIEPVQASNGELSGSRNYHDSTD